MTDPRSPASVAWGITYTPANVLPGQGYWKCLSVEGPEEWGGRISTFVDLLGADGTRQIGVRVAWFWADDMVYKITEPKTGEPFAVDFVMNAANNAYGLQVAAGQPSDSLFGFGLAEFKPHHVFRVIFQWQPAGTPPTDPPTVPNEVTLSQALDEVVRWAGIARRLGER